MLFFLQQMLIASLPSDRHYPHRKLLQKLYGELTTSETSEKYRVYILGEPMQFHVLLTLDISYHEYCFLNLLQLEFPSFSDIMFIANIFFYRIVQ